MGPRRTSNIFAPHLAKFSLIWIYRGSNVILAIHTSTGITSKNLQIIQYTTANRI